MRKIYLLLIITFITVPELSLFSQDRNQETIPLRDSLSYLKKELYQIQQEQKIIKNILDSLLLHQNIMRHSPDKTDDDLRKLLEEAKNMADEKAVEDADQSKKFHSGVRQQQGLNPNISLGGDFFAAKSSSNNNFISDPGDVSYGNNGFFLREIELGIEAPLDPFTRGKTFLSISKDAIGIEEAYMEWLNLPLKMNLKIGIFYSEFGPLNRYHDHALPQFDRPRALVNLFSNKGLGGTGLSANFMLPEILFANASSFDFSIVNGTNTGEYFSFDNNGLLYIGQFKNFYDISLNSFFEFRLSGITGINPSTGANRSHVGSLGLNYKWVPAGREKYRTLDWKTEFLFSYRNEESGPVKSKGFYSSLQNKLSARFWAGARIGYSELPYDNRQREWDYTVNLDFWQSEFVFTRIQYQYNQRNIYMTSFPGSALPKDHSIILQVCWAMGPHKHEAY